MFRGGRPAYWDRLPRNLEKGRKKNLEKEGGLHIWDALVSRERDFLSSFGRGNHGGRKKGGGEKKAGRGGSGSGGGLVSLCEEKFTLVGPGDRAILQAKKGKMGGIHLREPGVSVNQTLLGGDFFFSRRGKFSKVREERKGHGENANNKKLCLDW